MPSRRTNEYLRIHTISRISGVYQIPEFLGDENFKFAKQTTKMKNKNTTLKKLTLREYVVDMEVSLSHPNTIN